MKLEDLIEYRDMNREAIRDLRAAVAGDEFMAEALCFGYGSAVEFDVFVAEELPRELEARLRQAAGIDAMIERENKRAENRLNAAGVQ